MRMIRSCEVLVARSTELGQWIVEEDAHSVLRVHRLMARAFGNLSVCRASSYPHLDDELCEIETKAESGRSDF
ncbi:unnamed protein product [Rhodiola kirilowii]